MAIEVATSPVVVLGGSWVGMARQYLGVSKRHPSIQSIRNSGVAQRVGTDVPRDPGGLRDSLHHPVDVAPIDWLA